MKTLTGTVSWLIMAIVMAVPAFLFYNWWANNHKKGEQAVQSGINTPRAFMNAQTEKLPASQPDAVTMQSMHQPVTRNPVVVSTKTVIKSVSNSQLPQAWRAEASAVAESTTSASQRSTDSQVVTSTSSYFEPKTTRDPTISPEEYAQMREQELAKKEAERERELAMRKQGQDAGGASRIRLQGIVGTSAIINGEMFYAGNSINGIKLLKVGANYIIGEYKGKKFKKTI